MKKAFVFGLSILILFVLYFSLPKVYAGTGIPSTVDTAVGPVGTDLGGLSRNVFDLVLGMAGGIAVIVIIIAGYRFMVSQGNPEAIKGATEQLTSAIIGLLFIIFSFVILQIIGSDIFGIDKFRNLQ